MNVHKQCNYHDENINNEQSYTVWYPWDLMNEN
jgi:hypothetical protein